MRIVFTIYLSFLFCLSYSQQIQNVKALQQGGKLLITYDLNDQSNKAYYVKLLMSKDGGVTFGEELKYVSGDVKNTKSGIGKRIIWDAPQEISYYDGEVVFRVEAVLKAAPLPEAFEGKYLKIELLNVKGTGNKITIDYLITSNKDGSFSLVGDKKERFRIFDTAGNEFAPTGGKFGDVVLSYSTSKKVVAGVPVKSQITFDNFNAESTLIPLFEIELFSYVDDCYSCSEKIKFRNIPVTR